MKKNRIHQFYIAATLIMMAISASVFGQEQTKDSLSYYLAVAMENNPGIKSQKLAHEAFLQKIPQAGAFEDPELSTDFYVKPMDIVGGRSIANVSLMQMFPWFGTRKAARVEANHMANMQNQQYRETVDELILQVSIQWYEMQKLNEQLNKNEENKVLLERLEQLTLRKFSSPSGTSQSNAAPVVSSNTASTPTRTSVSSGMGGMDSGSGSGMSEVLRIQLELVQIENNIESLHAQIKAEKAKFNAFLNREVTEEINIGNEINKVIFLFGEEEALRAMETNNPMLGMITEEGLAYKAKAEMDKKMSYPMIGLGVQYMVIGKTNDPMFGMGNMNGKDMIMPMVSVTLPIFRKKYDAQQKESKLWRESSDERFKDTFNTLKSDYYRYKNQLEDAERIVKMYEKQTTLARTTYNLIVKEFVTGKSDLTNVIQVQRQLLDYQLKKAEAIADYNIMAASIQKLLSFTDNK